MKTQNTGIANLRDELNHASIFACERCEKKFESKSVLKAHRGNVHGRNDVRIMWRQNLIESEKEITELKYKISTKLYCLKETEVSKNQTCRCRGDCLINHFKCNWMKSISTELMSRFQALEQSFKTKEKQESSSCNLCEENLANVSHLDDHMRTTHENVKHECGSCKEIF